jgi:hypothetical protein
MTPAFFNLATTTAFSITLFVTITLGSISLLLTSPVYQSFYSRLPAVTAENGPFSHQVARVTFEAGFLGSQAWPPCLNSKLCFTPAELSHLEDVRTIYRQLLGIGLLAASASLVLTIAGRLTLNRLIENLQRSVKLLFSLISLTTLAGLLFWDQVFTLFHQLLFPQGNWAFPASSLLITLYPVGFWQQAGLFLISTHLFTYLFLLLIPKNRPPRL